MTTDAQYFEEARDLFLQPGWVTFQEEIEEASELLTLESCTTVEEFWQARGRLSVLRQLARYEIGVLAAEDSHDA